MNAAVSGTVSTADIYVRLSHELEGSTSIQRQESECRRWCAKNGYTVRHVHVDRGISGYTHAQRDGFDAAIAAVIGGKADALVVWKLDRLSRRGIGQVGRVIEEFERVGGRLVSVQDQLDTAHPQARMIIALLSEYARVESETLGMRIRAALQAQRAGGLSPSGTPPFGYAIAPDGRLTPVEPAATLMRELFGQLVAGHNVAVVVARLNAHDQSNSRGNAWTQARIGRMIRNPAYAGLQPTAHAIGTDDRPTGSLTVYRNPDTGLPVSCLTPGAKPIITRAQQRALLEVLDERSERCGHIVHGRTPATALLLRGLGRCLSCNRLLTRQGGGYTCCPYGRPADQICLPHTTAGNATVDRHVTQAWQQLLTTTRPDTAQLRIQVTLRWEPPRRRLGGWRRLNAELAELHATLLDADEAHYVQGDLDPRLYARIVADLRPRITRIEHQLANTPQNVDTSALDHASYIDKHWQHETPEGRRALLRLAWTTIYLAKAPRRGYPFDPNRITYVRRPCAARR